MGTQRRTAGARSEKQETVQEALQVTWVLKGQLKSARMSYLRIGAMLVRVRDEKLFTALNHPDLEDYAEKRLKLGRSSLYQYVRVYDWVKASHPEWLEKKPEGFIPELTDVADLIWIENELKRADLSAKDRTELQNLRDKGLAGELRQDELQNWRNKGRKPDTVRSYLNKFRSLRTRCARIVGMPTEVIKCLDDAIDILQNHQQVAKCGFDMSEPRQDRKFV